jgi:hypothetical protein
LFGLAAIAGALVALAHQAPGVGVSASQETGWLRRLAAGGDAGAQLQLGLAYRDGRRGLAADPAAALRWLEASARGGNAYAADALAQAYASGAGTRRDLQQARRWWRAGARGGNPDAQMHLGTALLARGRDGEGLAWLRAAADRGEPRARATLARLYRNRPLTDVDLHRGENPLAAVAERTDDDVLRLGLGVWRLLQRDADSVPTVRTLSRRAAAHDPAAEYQLALRYRDGAWGGERDPQRARSWLQRAAEDGSRVAVQALATSHWQHSGVGPAPDDPPTAPSAQATHS